MKQAMGFGGLFSVFFMGLMMAVVVVLCGSVSVSASPDWISGSVSVSGSRAASVGRYLDFPCSGVEYGIRVLDVSDENACVFGEPGSLRVARYASGGILRYGISFPLDSQFFPLQGFCENNHRCIYSSSADIALVSEVTGGPYFGAVIHKKFSSYVHSAPTPAGPGFRYQPPSTEIINRGGVPLPASGMNLSSNGKWAVVEARDFGLLRVDTDSGAIRRFSAPGAVYGRGNDPVYELAVSNSGDFVVTTGVRLGIVVHHIDQACGDTPSAASTKDYEEGVIRCKARDLDRYELFPGFVYATQPHISEDALRLMITVKTTDSVKRHTVRVGSVGPQDGSGTTVQKVDYVALGDSYTSGEGETSDARYLPGTNELSSTCHISDRSYPYRVAILWEKIGLNLACSGARVGDVMYGSMQRAGQLMSAVAHSPDVLSLSVGGNDVGLIAKLKACLGIGTCEWAVPGLKRFAAYREIVDFYDVLISTFSTVRRYYTEGAVVALGYPHVINKDAPSACDPLTSFLINQDERLFMHRAVTLLNDVIESAALRSGVRYIDIEGAFGENRLCDQGQRAMNALRVGDDIAPINFLEDLKVIGAESYHPTPYGHQMVAKKITDELSWSDARAPVSSQTKVKPPPDEYWQSQASPHDSPRLVAVEGLARVSLQNRRLDIETPSRMFLPNTTVRVELHSEPLTIGEVLSTDSGSLLFTGDLPSGVVEGFHSLHFYGALASGGDGDVYMPLFIPAIVDGTGGGPSPQTDGSLVKNSSTGSSYVDIKTTSASLSDIDSRGRFGYSALGVASSPDASGPLNVLGQASADSPPPQIHNAGWAALVLSVSVALLSLLVLIAIYYRKEGGG